MTHTLSNPMESRDARVDLRSVGRPLLPTALPQTANTAGTKLSDTAFMSLSSSSEAEAWYGPITLSAVVLKASKTSSTVSIQDMYQMSAPRTFMLFRTPSVNLLLPRLSMSTMTIGILVSDPVIPLTASPNGTVLPLTAGTVPENQASDAWSSPSYDAKTAGTSMHP